MKIKVCFVGDDVRPPWNHASSILTKRLIQCLSSEAAISLVTTIPEDNDGFSFGNCEAIYVESSGVRAIDALKLAVAAEKTSADVFHVIGTNALLFSPACKVLGAKGAIIRQIFTPYDQSDRLASPLRRLVNSGFIRAYAFTTPWIGPWNDELASSIVKFVLRPPIDCNLYRPLGETGDGGILELDGHDYYLLYMGPLWESRFPPRPVLNALKQVSDEGLDLHLTVLASASRTTSSQVEQISSLSESLGVRSLVTVKRMDLTEPDRVKAYNEADLVIFPYKGPEPEQLADPPFTILESMACGRPVLTTGVLSIPEVMEDEKNGFVIKTLTTEALAAGIRRALTFSKNDELGERARHQILQAFSFPAVRQEALKLYDSLF